MTVPGPKAAATRLVWKVPSPVVSDRDILERYLSKPVATDGYEVASSLWLALNEARALTGRNLTTGQVEDPEGSRSWLGALGYLCLLDQLGTAVKRPSLTPGGKKNGLERALLAFTDLDGDHRDATVALRNAFAHDYSLINQDKHGKPGRHHRFQLSPDPGPFLQLPPQRWSGTWADLDGGDTLVSLRGLGDRVESVVDTVGQCFTAGDLEIGLPGGAQEMALRYFHRYPVTKEHNAADPRR